MKQTKAATYSIRIYMAGNLAQAEPCPRVGRYVVKGGRVVEWEILNAADERPDGTYELRSAAPAEAGSARTWRDETILDEAMRAGEAGSAPLVLPEDDPVRAGFERWAFSVGWRNFTRDEHSGAYVVEGGLEHRWIGWRACHAYPLHATPMSPKQESR